MCVTWQVQENVKIKSSHSKRKERFLLQYVVCYDFEFCIMLSIDWFSEANYETFLHSRA